MFKVTVFKPGACPQPALAYAWFTEIVFTKTCVRTYLPTHRPTDLSMFVRTYPRDQILLVVKAVSL